MSSLLDKIIRFLRIRKIIKYIPKNSNLEFKKFEILNRIPLESESVDVVTMLAVLEHIENPQEILNQF